ncbi:MAG: exonuclease domain-containing protein, partial [Ilumatobacteraceae bacterium]
MSDPVHSTRFAVVDTETTGLYPATNRVLQIGVVIVRGDGTVEHQFATHIKRLVLKPGRLGAHHVHGITRV